MTLAPRAFALLTVACALLGFGCARGQPPVQEGSADSVAVITALRSFYAALQSSQPLDRVVAPAFFAYDGGVRYDADELVSAVSKARARGVTYEWNLSDFETHVSGDQAWVAYKNMGGIRDEHGFTPLTWLESAVLVRTPFGWRVRFLHATRAKAS